MASEDTTSQESISPAEYLDQQGAVALLCTIDPGGSRFTELADALSMSRTTLSRRLDEAQEHGLIAPQEVTDDRRAAHEYALTEAGARLRMLLDQGGVTSTYRSLTHHRQQLEEQVAGVGEWLERNELHEMSDTANARSLLRRLNPNRSGDDG